MVEGPGDGTGSGEGGSGADSGIRGAISGLISRFADLPRQQRLGFIALAGVALIVVTLLSGLLKSPERHENLGEVTVATPLEETKPSEDEDEPSEAPAEAQETPSTAGADTPSSSSTSGSSSSGSSGSGNRSSSRTIVVRDTTAPSIGSTVKPARPDGRNGWYRTQPIVTLSSNDPAATIRCSLSDSPFFGYLSALKIPTSRSDLKFFATDAAGNTSATKRLQFAVDITPPTAPRLSVGDVTTSTIELTWSTGTDSPSGVDRYHLYTPGPSIKTTTRRSITLSGLKPDMSYSYNVRAQDTAGNYSNLSNGITVRTDALDKTPPVTTLVASPASPDGLSGWYVTPPTIALTSNEPGSVAYAWGAAAFQPYTLPLTAAEGTSTLRFYSRDVAGNAEMQRSATFRVDSAAPDAPVLSASLVDEAALLAWSPSSDLGSGLASYRLHSVDGSVVATAAASVTTWTVDPSATTAYYVQALDRAGNESARSNTVTVTADAGGLGVESGMKQGRWSEARALGVSLTLEKTDAGALRVKRMDVSDGRLRRMPTHFRPVAQAAYFISTTSDHSGAIRVSVPVPDTIPASSYRALRLLHWDGRRWEDVTTSYDSTSRTITGEPGHLSPFVVAFSSDGGAEEPETVSVPASSPLTLALLAIAAIFVVQRRRRVA